MSGSDSHARSVSSLLQHSLPTLLREQGVDHVDVLPQRQGNSGGVPSEGSPNDEAREGLRNRKYLILLLVFPITPLL